MTVQRFLALGLAAAFCTPFSHVKQERTPRVLPNDNRVAAGRLENGVLTLRLEARNGQWFPDGDSGASLVLQHFAEVGRAPQNPGPLIRVRSGTTIRVSIHNVLDSVLVLSGLHTRPGTRSDTIHVAPGSTREVSFSAGQPGTYFYWGTTTGTPVADRNKIDSQLHGAFIIDPSNGPVRPDRVFVLGSWTGPVDTVLDYAPDLRTINGLSWPHTERLTYTAGDTIVWRWLNPTDSPHPMHLHGFYFDVLSRGTWAADTTFAENNRPFVVTEQPVMGQTFTMRWIPAEPGNWLMHCHLAYHTSVFLSAKLNPDPKDPVTLDHVHGMHGMVLGVTVNPGASGVRRAETAASVRNIRLIAQAAPGRYRVPGSYGGAQGVRFDEMAFVLQEGANAPASDSVPVPSSLLVLKRDQPVRITIVNKLRTATGVHWHGIEVPSYSDGVPEWSGYGSRLAPPIAPGDSFVAAFTPKRSGTFIYHAHSNEAFQISLGLYGGLLVTDSGTYSPDRDRLIIIGSAGPLGARGARINGSLTPDTMRLKVGTSYRLRLIHLVTDVTTFVSLVRDVETVQWRALARDGAELPPAAQVMGRSILLTGPGETTDFEYTPTSPGVLQLIVRQRAGRYPWRSVLPIRVEE